MNGINEFWQKAHYQTFDIIGGPPCDSDSPRKYTFSRLDEMDLAGKDVLDIGCNAGYFLFRLLHKKPRYLCGVDSGEKFIRAATEINNKYFRANNIKLLHGDFFAMVWPAGVFDLIICLSTFHYFDGREELFFDYCRVLLRDGGTLLLEIEEHPENDEPCLRRCVRPADKKEYPYPNEKLIKKWAAPWFNIAAKYQSIKQGGTLYERFFYRLQKI